MTSVPVAEGVFAGPPGAPHLIGGRCVSCGAVAFPVPPSCSRCAGQDIEAVDLPARGTLWTWTIQGFLPKNPPYAGTEGPKEFVPYGVGYVDLGVVKVETRLTENDPARLRIGMPVELVLVPFTTDAEGHEVITYAFAPVGESS